MRLSSVKLKNFRNFQEKLFSFSPFLTIVNGKNSVGKTNLLEAVYFGFNGQGFREKKENQLIQFGKNNTEVELKFIDKDSVYLFRINLRLFEQKTKKLFFVCGTKKNFSYYKEEIGLAIIFTPQDIEIITRTPEERRRYFDILLSQFDWQYKNALINYKNALKRRNKLLQTITDKNQLKNEIKFWDKFLENFSQKITEKRQSYINFLNKNNKIDSFTFKITYLKNDFTKTKAQEFFEKETKIKQTLIGPQKDDFQIFINEKNVHFFGSRSEQRLALFWLKFSEIKYQEEIFKKKPLLLLDDIFSELDMDNKKLIFNLIYNYQTIITTADPLIFNLPNLPKTIINLKSP